MTAAGRCPRLGVDDATLDLLPRRADPADRAFLGISKIRRAQLPDVIRSGGGTVLHRPKEWA